MPSLWTFGLGEGFHSGEITGQNRFVARENPLSVGFSAEVGLCPRSSSPAYGRSEVRVAQKLQQTLSHRLRVLRGDEVTCRPLLHQFDCPPGSRCNHG